jgi:capsular exopolysaccharide synthesis family protein
MSKFFSETSRAQQSHPVPTNTNVDIHQAVSSLKQSLDGTSPTAAAAEPAPVVKQFLSNTLASQVAAGRLEKSRAIRLPRQAEKSFLVTQYNAQMQAAVEAYRTLRTRLVKQQTKSGARSLVVSSAGPEEGKTLTTFNLALCYANIQNWPVLAVDADLRKGGLSRLFGDPESPGLAGILEGMCDPQPAVLRTDVPGLSVLPAGETKISPPELFAGGRWKEFIGWASETFRLVIVDSPPALNLADWELILASCESALLIVRNRKTSREALAKMLAQVDAKKVAGVVFNAAEGANHKYYSYTNKP